MTIIDGKATAAQIKAEIAKETEALKAAGRRAPHLALLEEDFIKEWGDVPYIVQLSAELEAMQIMDIR